MPEKNCMSVTFHADHNICMMKNHIQFDYKRYDDVLLGDCDEIKHYMFQVIVFISKL